MLTLRANAVLERICVKKPDVKRYSPCGKPARVKAVELHTVSEIMLDVVCNIKWCLNAAAFSCISAGKVDTHLFTELTACMQKGA